MNSSDPTVSVITICFNAAGTIGQTIDCVQQASGDLSIEHIIVDGQSSDGTQDIVRAKLRECDTFISEPDDGISDAFNKGLRRCRGEYIHFLNADDWVDSDFWTKLLTDPTSKSAKMIHSDLIIYAQGKQTALERFSGLPNYFDFLRDGMKGIYHPSMLFHTNIFDEVGHFDTDLKVLMDVDFLQRAEIAGFRSQYIPGANAHFRLGGASYSNLLTSVLESDRLARRNNISLHRRLSNAFKRVARQTYRNVYPKFNFGKSK